MDFIHRPYQPGETIAAIATPHGEGGVAVIRISGNEALDIAAKVFSGPIRTFRSHTAHVGKILDSDRQIVDEVLAITMLQPRSYTGEDTVEIHCHGGLLITRRVLETILSAGARAALPGEFTFKAFINGKIDLAQAEAVQELIGAKNDLALNAAEQQLQGALSQKIASFQQELIDIAAILEAWVDFPEEDLEFATIEEVVASLYVTQSKMQQLADTFHEGKIVREGISLCLAGPPNAGKSSLMNALLGKERAIVTPIAGTTRDLIEDDLKLGHLHFKIIDTAGIRDTDELIEQEGIRRSKDAMEKADLILLVMDASTPLTEHAHTLLSNAPHPKTILVWNKTDLAAAPLETHGFSYIAPISAKTNTGMSDLHRAIESLIWQKGVPAKDEVVITQMRHKQALSQAIHCLMRVIEGLQSGVSPEWLASDMLAVLKELGTIRGTNISEDLLSTIFSKFCIGK